MKGSCKTTFTKALHSQIAANNSFQNKRPCGISAGSFVFCLIADLWEIGLSDGNQTILVWHALASKQRHMRDKGPELEALVTFAAPHKSAMNRFVLREQMKKQKTRMKRHTL